MEDDLLWEDNLWRKTTLSGRRLSVEDDIQWKMTFGGRRPLVEEDLFWKTHVLEDELQWKTLDPCMLPTPLCGGGGVGGGGGVKLFSCQTQLLLC